MRPCPTFRYSLDIYISKYRPMYYIPGINIQKQRRQSGPIFTPFHLDGRPRLFMPVCTFGKCYPSKYAFVDATSPLSPPLSPHADSDRRTVFASHVGLSDDRGAPLRGSDGPAEEAFLAGAGSCLLYTSPSPRD